MREQFEEQLGEELSFRFQNARDSSLQRIRREAPQDTGNLADNGIDWEVTSRSLPVLSATLRATAESENGADYAAILEKVRRIAPRFPNQFVKFNVPGVSGPIYSRGFTNVHYRWWTKTTDKLPTDFAAEGLPI